MSCEEARRLIEGYADGELDLRTSLDVEQHLKECPSCAQDHESRLALRAALKEKLPYHEASAALRKRVRTAIRAETRSRSRLGFVPTPGRWPVAAAAVLLVAVLGRGLILGPSSNGDVGHEVIASHVRSLMANHLTDVLSSNQHTVKPWFDGKLDFAPVVLDLSTQGFPLFGGRLDYIDGHPVAALVYHYRLHVINLFTWPNRHGPDTEMHTATQEGYNSIHWTQSGMDYWAVSDVAPAQLEKFAQFVRGGIRQ
jgi:anti-sigma factor RsiW